MVSFFYYRNRLSTCWTGLLLSPVENRFIKLRTFSFAEFLKYTCFRSTSKPTTYWLHHMDVFISTLLNFLIVLPDALLMHQTTQLYCSILWLSKHWVDASAVFLVSIFLLVRLAHRFIHKALILFERVSREIVFPWLRWEFSTANTRFAVITQSNMLVGVLGQRDEAGMQVLLLVDLSCADCCPQVKVVIEVVLVHELSIQTTHVLSLLLICAPEIASLSDDSADYVDLVNEGQPRLSLRLMLQVLVHLVCVVVLDAF